MSKKTQSPEEISKQLASFSPMSPVFRDDTDTGFPLTPPVFSDLSSAPSTLSKDSMANVSTSTSTSTSGSKKGLTPLNLSGFSSVSSAPSASASASGRSYLSSPASYTSKASRGSEGSRPLSAIPNSPDIFFSPLLPSPSPVSSVSSQQKVKKPSVLVPVTLSSSASDASKPHPLSQPSTI